MNSVERKTGGTVCVKCNLMQLSDDSLIFCLLFSTFICIMYICLKRLAKIRDVIEFESQVAKN